MSGETHQMTLRLPVAVYERLRREAFEQRVSMNEIITVTLDERLPAEPRDQR